MTEDAASGEKSLSQKSVEGTALLVATRFFVRLIGFASVSVTARLLTPEDFGVVGAASLVVALFLILNQIGMTEYVIRAKKIDMAELHTMWTLRLTVSSIIGLLIYFSAPVAAGLLQEPRLIEILQVLSVLSVLGALRSPAGEFLNRELRYGRYFVLMAADKVAAVTATVVAALILKSYWALVWGQVVGVTFGILSSQIARPFKPVITFAKVSNMKSFAFWTFMVGLNKYGIRQADEWIAKRASDSAAFGAYHVARDLCRLFVTEVVAPAGQVFFPAISKVQEDEKKLSEVVGRFAGASFIAAFAVATGVAAVSTELVYLLLGYQWGAAIPYIPYVAAGTAAIAVGDLFNGLYIVANRQNIATRFRFAQLSLIVIGCGTVAKLYTDLLLISQMFAGIAILTVVVELIWLFSKSNYDVALLPRLWRPAIAAAMMFYSVRAIEVSDEWSLIVIAVIKVSMGATIYVSSLFGLWFLSGKPVGGETEFLDRVKDYFR